MRIKNFWLKYENKIILVAGLILVSVVSFEAGILKGRELKENPIVIEKAADKSVSQASENAPATQNLPKEGENTTSDTKIQNCAFVGSKNSNKYHLPSCRWAKQIKPENKICFKDENEAKAKGYLPDNNCIK